MPSLGEQLDPRQLLKRLADGSEANTPINTLGFARRAVVETPDGTLAVATAAPFSAGRLEATHEDSVTCRELPNGQIELSNAALRAVFSRDGLLQSLIHNATQREALKGPGNRIVLFDDRPLDYEAWDIDPFALETARNAEPAHTCSVVSTGPLRTEIRFERRLGRESAMTQIVRLDAGSNHLVFDTTIEWKDRRTLVKAMFPLSVHAKTATYETMFGVAERPTHANTDGDLAKYEVPGQRWADVSEPNFGVSLLSDTRHGYSCFENQLALTLIRGPVWPDRNADVGTHHFSYAIYPHTDDWRDANTVAEAACFARPMVWAKGEAAELLQNPLVTSSAANVVIDTVKPAEEGDGWIVRLYESAGARTTVTLSFSAPIDRGWHSNTLEEEKYILVFEDGSLTLDLKPFQIMTLKLK